VLAAVLLAGCSIATQTIDQRTSQGPTADLFWTTQLITANGR